MAAEAAIFDQFASNDVIADKLRKVGFSDVVVIGNGSTRQAEATWNGPDTTAQLDSHLSNVVDFSAGVPASRSTIALEKPNTRLMTPIACSTRARTFDLVRFSPALPHRQHRDGGSDW